MSPMRWVEAAVIGLLSCALVVDGALMVRARRVVGASMTPDQVSRPGNDASLLLWPEAFSGSGEPLTRPKTPGGWALRYASSLCLFCAKDTHWADLGSNLDRAGIPVLVVLPTAAERMETETLIPKRAPQAAFLPVEWLGHLRLTMTPTVILVDAKGRIAWHHAGVLGTSDVESAVQVIGSRLLPGRSP
jgi:hypothetical protein